MGVPLHVTLAPAAAEPDLAGGTPVTVRFPDAGLAERAVRRLLALGNDRVAVAGTLADGGVLLRVAGPSYFLVQEWRETEGVTVYVAAAAAGAAGRAELWVEWGWRLREPEPARLGADGGPLAADRARGLVSWEGLAFRDLYAALQIHAGVLRGAAVESAGPPPQFSLTVRLVRRAVPAAPELWVLEASRAEELQALLDAATRAELRRLELACVTCGAQPLLILREVVTRGSSVGAGLRGAAYARLRGGGDVYVPVGWTLWPELRRDELARALGASVTGEALTIVEPAAGREANGAPGARAAGEAGTNVERAGGREANGGLAVWRVPAGAFGGIDRLVDWRIDALETDVRAALLGAVFDAEEPSARPARSPVTSSSLSARTSELGSASRSASQSRSAPAEAATAAEAGTPTAAEGPGGGKPSGADAPSGREPARPTSAGPAAGAAPKAEARAAPTVSPSGGAARSDAGANQHAAARLAVLERAVLDAPLEAGRWVEAAQGHLAAGRLADAEATAEVALCLRPEGEPAERAWAVLRAGRADGLGARLRAVAAGAARAEVVALLEALAAADPDWPIPRRWLAWRELSRATADAALLEQARTRILSALSLVGLEARDLPAFVAGRLAERSAGGATGPAASADGPPRALAVLEVLEAWSGALADADQRFAAGAALARARRALGRAAMPAPAAAAAAKLVALPLRARALMDVAAAIAADDPPGAAAAFDQALATLSGPELAHSEQQERLLLRALAVAGALAPPQAAPLLARLLAAVAPLEPPRQVELLAGAAAVFARAGAAATLAARLRALLETRAVRASLHDAGRVLGALAVAAPAEKAPRESLAAARALLARRATELDDTSAETLVPLLCALGPGPDRLDALVAEVTAARGDATLAEVVVRAAAVRALAREGSHEKASARLRTALARALEVDDARCRRQALRAVAAAAGAAGDRAEGREVLRRIVETAAAEKVPPDKLWELGDVLGAAASAAGQLGDRAWAMGLLAQTRAIVGALIERSGGEAHYLFRTLARCLDRARALGEEAAARTWAAELVALARSGASHMNVLANPFERYAAQVHAILVLAELGEEDAAGLARTLERAQGLSAADRTQLVVASLPALAGLPASQAAAALSAWLEVAEGALAEGETDVATARLELCDEAIDQLVLPGQALARALRRFTATLEWALRDAVVAEPPPGAAPAGPPASPADLGYTARR